MATSSAYTVSQSGTGATSQNQVVFHGQVVDYFLFWIFLQGETGGIIKVSRWSVEIGNGAILLDANVKVSIIQQPNTDQVGDQDVGICGPKGTCCIGGSKFCCVGGKRVGSCRGGWRCPPRY